MQIPVIRARSRQYCTAVLRGTRLDDKAIKKRIQRLHVSRGSGFLPGWGAEVWDSFEPARGFRGWPWPMC